MVFVQHTKCTKLLHVHIGNYDYIASIFSGQAIGIHADILMQYLVMCVLQISLLDSKFT